jgi:hypothetical protein
MTVDILMSEEKNDVVDMAMEYMDSLQLDIRIMQLSGGCIRRRRRLLQLCGDKRRG